MHVAEHDLCGEDCRRADGPSVRSLAAGMPVEADASLNLLAGELVTQTLP